jgi:mycothiol synthase
VVDLTIRPYQPSDASALADLLNAIEQFVGAHPFFTDEEVRSFFGGLDDPALNTRVVTVPDGSMVACAMVDPPPPGGFRVGLFGGVRPSWRGLGIGRDLFSWQQERAEEVRRTAGPGVEWIAEAHSNVKDPSAVRLFERFGMTPRRHWFDMEVSIDAATPIPLADGLRSVPVTPERFEALHAAHMEAFADHFGFQYKSYNEWAKYAVQFSKFRPELSRIALDGDEIAGYVLGYDENGDERFYFGQVGTRRPWRRRGVAGALLSEALVAAASAGKKVATLGVDAESPTGAVGVYERVGFGVIGQSVSYSRPL